MQMNDDKYTLYELATQFDADVQVEGIPKLAEWLFKDYFNRFQGTLQQGIAGTFISNFIRKYLNREIFHRNKDVFRSALYYELNKYYEYLSTVSDEYRELSNASVSLIESVNRDVTANGIKNNTQNINGSSTSNGEFSNNSNDNRTLKNKATTNSSVDNTGTQATEENENRLPNVTRTSSNKSSNSLNDATRVLNSDYPQSNVSATVQPTTEWSYASRAQDTHNNKTGSEEGTTTETTSGKEDVLRDRTLTNNLKTEEASTHTIEETDGNLHGESGNNSGSTTTKQDTEGNETTTNNEKEVVTRSHDGLSQFDKLMQLLEYMDNNPYNPVFKVIEKLDKYFISIYVDEDRDGWIDPNVNILKYIVGGSV